MEDKEETEVDKKEEDTEKKDDVNGEEGSKEVCDTHHCTL